MADVEIKCADCGLQFLGKLVISSEKLFGLAWVCPTCKDRYPLNEALVDRLGGRAMKNLITVREADAQRRREERKKERDAGRVPDGTADPARAEVPPKV